MRNNHIIVIGSSFVGMITSLLLAKHGFQITLIDKENISKKFKVSKKKKTQPDIRGIALTPFTTQYIGKDLWEQILPHTHPIKCIDISDNYSRILLDFIQEDNSDLGYIVEGNILLSILYENICKEDNITLYEESDLKSLEQHSNYVEIQINQQQTIQADLLIACDGKNSYIRNLLDIKCKQHDYQHSCIVFTIEHDLHHQGVAEEKFYKEGPFALLPMHGGHSSAVVWTEPTDIANYYINNMSPKELTYHLKEKINSDRLGSDISIVSKINCYPLSYTIADHYVKQRCVLAGNAAASVHPIAGQGLNSSIKSLKILLDSIIENYSCGIDIGDYTVLSRYNQEGRRINLATLYITHHLDDIFRTSNPIIKTLRCTGMSIMDKIPWIKKKITSYAMGLK